MVDLKKTRIKLSTIKKAYDILLSAQYIDNIAEAFDHKTKLLRDIIDKQTHFITLLKGNQKFTARDRLAAKL